MLEKPLPVRLDASGLTPIHAQLSTQIRHLILSGTLAADEQLPSVRGLAKQILVNPNTIARVYRDLLHDGWVTTKKGEGCYVTPRAEKAQQEDRVEELRPQARRLVDEAKRLDISRTRVDEVIRNEWDDTKEGGGHEKR